LSSDPAPGAGPPGLVASLPDEALEEINRLWTVVRAFSSTAHDVNNAMQVIAGNAELLESHDFDPVVRRRIEVIRSEAARVSVTINRLLEYAREREAIVQRLDLWLVVEHAVALRASSAGRRRVVIAIERTDRSPVLATVDRSKMLQLWLDLLLSAEDAVAGWRNARVTIALRRDGERVLASVSATGEAAPHPPETTGSAVRAALTADLQVWSASQLAAGQHGQLDVIDEGNGRTYVLQLPSGT
jgi:signal transduction histidine kinase